MPTDLPDKTWFANELAKLNPQEPPEPPKKPPTDIFLNYAFQVLNGACEASFIYCIEEDKVFMYDTGYWRHIFEKEFLKIIQERIPSTKKFSANQRKQIIENFKIIGLKPLKEFNWSDSLTFNNCVVDPYDRTIVDHDPKYYSTIKLKYDYLPEAKCPLWDKTLDEIFESSQEKKATLQEFFGYCLLPDVEQKKALLLLGDSDTGKSTILFTLRDMVGGDNVSSVPLKYLSHPQYAHMMINKLVNIDADVDKKAENYEAEFKMVTSGEHITCNPKYVQSFDFIPKCKIILAANEFPRILDHSSAFYKRLILIPCDRIFEEHEKNRNLTAQLKDELPGIFNWSMEGLIRLKERGYFNQYDFSKEAVAELEEENNPVNIFFNENVEIDCRDNVYIEKSELYEKYIEWCKEKDRYSLNHIRFARAVYKRFHQYTPKQARIKGNGAYIWKNIRMKLIIPKESQEIAWQQEN